MPRAVNTIYIAATSAADVAALRDEISARLPSATITTSSDLAGAVTGSLASASRLADDLGRWLAALVLAAALLAASAFTTAALSRRVKEIGTLKALGWSSRRVVAQVIAEATVRGALGALAGVALGAGGTALVTTFAPTFTASAEPSTIPGADTSESVVVHLTAQVTARSITLAVVLATAGGLAAGAIGAWRAARLHPAAALARVR
jgi:putative ABC transport system permease protein